MKAIRIVFLSAVMVAVAVMFTTCVSTKSCAEDCADKFPNDMGLQDRCKYLCYG